jgi:hypothetical protein
MGSFQQGSESCPPSSWEGLIVPENENLNANRIMRRSYQSCQG